MRARAPKLISFPFDLGGDRSGTRFGPDAFLAYAKRDPDLAPIAAHALDALFCDPATASDLRERFWTDVPSQEVPHYCEETAAACMILGHEVGGAIAAGFRPIVIGGDHCAPMGSIASAFGAYGKRLGVVWIDAHLDAHAMTTGSPSNNTNGMPIAALLGAGHPHLLDAVGVSAFPNRFMDPMQWFHIGADSYEPGEKQFIRSCVSQGFTLWAYRDLEHANTALLESLRAFVARMDAIWVSFDLDAVHAFWAPAVAYDRDGRMSMGRVLEIAALLGASGKVVGGDIVELNPRRERAYRYGRFRGRPKTALLAAEFMKRILAIESTVDPYRAPEFPNVPCSAAETTPPA